jgi:transposase
MVDTESGEFTEKILSHEGNTVRAFYAALEGPGVVGIEATGSMQWFLELLEELGIQCRVGHPAEIRAKETRKQKHDRRDARLIGELLIEEAGPAPVGEDASAIAAHVAGDRTQSRLATRPRALERSGAERTGGTASATLHQSETDRATKLVRTVAETNPGTG